MLLLIALGNQKDFKIFIEALVFMEVAKPLYRYLFGSWNIHMSERECPFFSMITDFQFSELAVLRLRRRAAVNGSLLLPMKSFICLDFHHF